MTDVIYAAIRILAGFGAFLLGFKLLGDNLERIAGNGLKRCSTAVRERRPRAWGWAP